MVVIVVIIVPHSLLTKGRNLHGGTTDSSPDLRTGYAWKPHTGYGSLAFGALAVFRALGCRVGLELAV